MSVAASDLTAGPWFTLGDLPLFGVDSDGCDWGVDFGSAASWWGSPAPTLPNAQRPRGHGVWVGESWLAGRTIQLDGEVRAPSRWAALGALNRLNAAVAVGGTTLEVVEPDFTTRATVYRSDDVTPAWVDYRTVKFTVQLLAPDPRRLGDPMSDSTGLPSVSGGFTAPFTAPFTVSTNVVSGIVGMTNPGTIDGPVSLRIDGPVVGPVVTHTTSGKQIRFASNLSLAAGDWIDIDMVRHTVLANGTASRAGSITSRGWSTFESGDNSWAFSAVSGGAGALLTVVATPAWM